MLKILACLLAISFASPANCYVLTSPPRESKEAGKEFYGPLADYLTKVLGTKITYKHPGSWLRYQRSIKRNEYDIVFDGPHLASWRIKHHDHTPMMKLTGKLIFYFVTKTEHSHIQKPKDFAAKKICVLPPPNLNSLILLSELNGPARDPVIKSIKGGLRKVITGLFDDKCVGAVIPAGFYKNKLTQQERDQLRIIYQSKPLSNQVITASARFSSQQINIMMEALKQQQGTDVINKFGKRFGKKFEPADKISYEGASHLLEGVVIGWEGKNKRNFLKDLMNESK